MGRRFAVVTTTRNPGSKIRSFVQYHKAIGFDRVYLYFDDPSDADLSLVADEPDVVITPCDTQLRREWEQTPLYTACAPLLGTEVMARQMLNVCHAMKRARHDGIDWLFHLDDDELFYLADATLDELFEEIDADEAETVRFLNLEAVVEGARVRDPFLETLLFKKNPALLTDEQVRTLTNAMAGRGRRVETFFTAYVNGKSAVSTKSDLVPDGVHRFGFPRLKDAAERSSTVVDCSGPCFVLHYPNAGFDSFLQKYRILGNFPDYYLRSVPIQKGAFHTDARDAVMRGDEQEALRFYMERVVTAPEVLGELHGSGVVDRIDKPRLILSRLEAR